MAVGQRVTGGRLTGWLVFVGVLTLVNWAGRLSEGQPPKDAAYRWDVAIGSVVQFAFMLGIVAAIAWGAWDMLALRRPHNWGRAIGTALLVLLAIDLLTAALSPVLEPGREQGLTPTGWDSSRAPQFFLFAFAVVVLGPVTEELTFRGLGYALFRPFGLVPAIVGVSVLWALAHGLLEALPIITALGIGLAWLRHRQDSTIPGIVLHSTFNAIALAYGVLT